MSIKLNYSTINSPVFMKALAKLSQEKEFGSFKASYNVARIVRQFEKEIKVARELYNKWAVDFFEKDEKGVPIVAKNGPFTHEISKEKELEFIEKWKEFLNHEVVFESDKLTQNDLGLIKLTPDDILALTPIFDFESV